jgi:Protein of unknown function (DUF2806)
LNDEPDPLAGEISVEVSLDEKGIKASAKSRAVAALDRLCGSILDLPGGFFEGKGRRQRIRNRVHEALIMAEGQAALEKATGDPDFGRRVLDNFADDLARKQDNKDAVAALAIEDLRERPSEPVEDQGTIDDDWLNLFSSHAENASSEHLQRMWGKVLAGEIRQPGSFSLSTLRFISELDRDIATVFQESVRVRLDDQFLVKKENQRGKDLLDAVFLEEVGLLQQVTGIGGLNITYTYNNEGVFSLRQRNVLLIATGVGGTQVEVPVIKITRTGQEVASILPAEAPSAVLREIAERFMSTATTIELALVTADYGDGRVSYQVFEKLK